MSNVLSWRWCITVCQSPYLEVNCELSSIGCGSLQYVKVLTWRLIVSCPHLDMVHRSVSHFLEVKCELSAVGGGASKCVKVLTWRLFVNCPHLDVMHHIVSKSLIGGLNVNCSHLDVMCQSP